MSLPVDEYSDSRLDIYTRMSEPQLRRIYEPEKRLFIAESPMVIKRALNTGYVPHSVLTCKEALSGHGRDVIERIRTDHPYIILKLYFCSKQGGKTIVEKYGEEEFIKVRIKIA